MNGQMTGGQVLAVLRDHFDYLDDPSVHGNLKRMAVTRFQRKWNDALLYFDPQNNPERRVWRRVFIMLLERFVYEPNYSVRTSIYWFWNASKDNSWKTELVDAKYASTFIGDEISIRSAQRLIASYNRKRFFERLFS